LLANGLHVEKCFDGYGKMLWKCNGVIGGRFIFRNNPAGSPVQERVGNEHSKPEPGFVSWAIEKEKKSWGPCVSRHSWVRARGNVYKGADTTYLNRHQDNHKSQNRWTVLLVGGRDLVMRVQHLWVLVTCLLGQRIRGP
jgi:hypothetical protein